MRKILILDGVEYKRKGKRWEKKKGKGVRHGNAADKMVQVSKKHKQISSLRLQARGRG